MHEGGDIPCTPLDRFAAFINIGMEAGLDEGECGKKPGWTGTDDRDAAPGVTRSWKGRDIGRGGGKEIPVFCRKIEFDQTLKFGLLVTDIEASSHPPPGTDRVVCNIQSTCKRATQRERFFERKCQVWCDVARHDGAWIMV